MKVEIKATVDLDEDEIASEAVNAGRAFDVVAKERGAQLEFLVNDVLTGFAGAERVKTSVVWLPPRES